MVCQNENLQQKTSENLKNLFISTQIKQETTICGPKAIAQASKMNKLAIQETFPPGIVGREIVLAQMCHHYRRISSAKARVDTNLFKPPKISLSRPLSAEVANIVQRSLSPRSPPKHRKCLKYEHEMGEHHIKPSVRSQTAESRLRATPEVYHPAVKSTKSQHQEFDGQQQGTQTSPENSQAEQEEPKTRDEAVQTVPPGLYRPLDGRSVQFLRDITNDALRRRAFTSSALNRIFLDHQFKNTHGLSQELMERELEELRRQLGMLPRRRSEGSTVSDAEALDALDSLVLDPRIKEQVIHSLRLTRENCKKPIYSYFDRLKFDEDEHPIRDQTSIKLRETLKAMESFGTANGSIEQVDEIPFDNVCMDKIIRTPHDTETEPHGGWNAEIDEEDREATTASSTRDEVDEDAKESDAEEEEEVVESVTDSDEEQSSKSSKVSNSESDEETEEVTQRESTSKPITDENSESRIRDVASKSRDTHHSDDISKKLSTKTSPTTEDKELEESNSFLTPLKLEPSTTKGDKWRSSLEAVKEESDSTAGQVSDISTASTPTEGESKIGNSGASGSTAAGSKDGQSSATYHSAESRAPTQDETEPTAESASVTLPNKQDPSSSTGGEIVRQMNDLLADIDASHGAGNVNLNTTISESGDVLKEQKGVQRKDEDETKSETGSEVESVHTDADEDNDSHSPSGSESDMESVHTD